MDSRMPTSLVNDALITMAIWKHRPNAGLLVHSDSNTERCRVFQGRPDSYSDRLLLKDLVLQAWQERYH